MPVKQTAQAFVELRADDPEAMSALGVAQAHLEAGRGLASLRRLRLFELSGELPPRGTLETLLHRSTQFYNPSKERCTVRAADSEDVPFAPDEHVVLVFERDGERRTAEERWWKHETGTKIEVREGVVWALRFVSADGAVAAAAALATATDRRQGLLCNPQFQESRMATPDELPLPWMLAARGRRGGRRRPGGGS